MDQCDEIRGTVIAEDYSLPSPKCIALASGSAVPFECSSCDICILMFLIHNMTTGTALVKMIFVADQLSSLQP